MADAPATGGMRNVKVHEGDATYAILREISRDIRCLDSNGTGLFSTSEF